MGDLVPMRVATTVKDGLGLPNRALQIHCKVSNPNPVDLFITDVWLDVQVINGPRLCEGRFFVQHHALAYPAIVQAHGSPPADGEILLPLDPLTLHAIEQHRKSGDLKLQIDSRVIVCLIARQAGGGLVIHTPRETRFCSEGDSYHILVTIPQSEWIKLLQRMQWSEIELLELPTEIFRSDSRITGARDRLRDAQTRLWSGDWEGTIESCRKAWESGARALTGAENNPDALRKLGARLAEEPKTEAVNELARCFGNFMHLARHDQPAGVKFTRADAILALNLTTVLLAYLVRVL